jgi:hypothetical protein
VPVENYSRLESPRWGRSADNTVASTTEYLVIVYAQERVSGGADYPLYVMVEVCVVYIIRGARV